MSFYASSFERIGKSVFLINENITSCTVVFSSLPVAATFLLGINRLSDRAMAEYEALQKMTSADRGMIYD